MGPQDSGVAYVDVVDGCSSSGPVYAGIGARETPESVLEIMEEIGTRMAEGGWVLRTGLSPGADQAFCRGACAAAGSVEAYLPWQGFECERCEASRARVFHRPAEAAYELASRYHPFWDVLDLAERQLRARDVHQVLGEHLDEPVEIVICWTVDGSLDGSSNLAGGTGQALRVAHHHGIPVFNLACDEHLNEALAFASRLSRSP